MWECILKQHGWFSFLRQHISLNSYWQAFKHISFLSIFFWFETWKLKAIKHLSSLQRKCDNFINFKLWNIDDKLNALQISDIVLWYNNLKPKSSHNPHQQYNIVIITDCSYIYKSIEWFFNQQTMVTRQTRRNHISIRCYTIDSPDTSFWNKHMFKVSNDLQ